MTPFKLLAIRRTALTCLLGLSLGGAASAESLHPQTRKNLETAMHGEAFANLKYQAYAEAARARGDVGLAKLFEESANVEANEHFVREASAFGLAGSDVANLTEAVSGEHYENSKMYVGFAEQANKVGDKKTAALFRQIAADEGDHYRQYKDALEARKHVAMSNDANEKEKDQGEHGRLGGQGQR